MYALSLSPSLSLSLSSLLPSTPVLPPQSVCSDGRLFSNLLAEWLFTEGPPHVCGPTCGLSVKVRGHKGPLGNLGNTGQCY